MDNHPRKRNAAATQVAILDAARHAFTDKGFDGAGLREIAGIAGVNVALINRYFGSKDQLFKIAIIDHLDLAEIFDGDMAQFGARIAANFLSHPIKKEGYDPTLAILRSAANERSVAAISAAVEEGICAPLTARLTDTDPLVCEAKSGMLVAVLLGYDMMRRVFQIQALGEDTTPQVEVLLAASLQSVIDAKL